ncbi:hypothetical protein HPB47_022269 [Ixodes persulcatus]|uniref:Uncharacterized protein n=1 Tax=Ixodes persulcatus TaxID=34615 RepID=A0AC60QA70_IXOPE|nr:hypothetical protein HPB47_022269 [Ixodes persulcatus]
MLLVVLLVLMVVIFVSAVIWLLLRKIRRGQTRTNEPLFRSVEADDPGTAVLQADASGGLPPAANLAATEGTSTRIAPEKAEATADGGQAALSDAAHDDSRFGSVLRRKKTRHTKDRQSQPDICLSKDGEDGSPGKTWTLWSDDIPLKLVIERLLTFLRERCTTVNRDQSKPKRDQAERRTSSQPKTDAALWPDAPADERAVPKSPMADLATASQSSGNDVGTITPIQALLIRKLSDSSVHSSRSGRSTRFVSTEPRLLVKKRKKRGVPRTTAHSQFMASGGDLFSDVITVAAVFIVSLLVASLLWLLMRTLRRSQMSANEASLASAKPHTSETGTGQTDAGSLAASMKTPSLASAPGVVAELSAQIPTRKTAEGNEAASAAARGATTSSKKRLAIGRQSWPDSQSPKEGKSVQAVGADARPGLLKGAKIQVKSRLRSSGHRKKDVGAEPNDGGDDLPKAAVSADMAATESQHHDGKAQDPPLLRDRQPSTVSDRLPANS